MKPKKMLTKERPGYAEANLSHAYNQACDDWEAHLPKRAELSNIVRWTLRCSNKKTDALINELHKRIWGE